MKKMFLFIPMLVIFMASCSQCVECNGTKYCEEQGAVYRDSTGKDVSWKEYSATIEANCQ